MLTTERPRIVRRKTKESVTYLEPEKATKSVSYSKAVSRAAERSISDTLANDKFHYVNYPVPQLRQNFYDKPSVWHVDKMYPYAQGGMLLIDEPLTPEEIDLCELKEVVLKRAGLRYIAILPDMSLAEAMITLGAVHDME